MNHKRAVLTIGLAVAAIALPALAQAQAYFGASLGKSDTKKFCGDAPNCSAQGTAWRIFGGAQFTRNLGAEIGLVDFGKATAGDPGNTAEVKRSGSDFLAVLSYPRNQLSVFGKAGAYYARSKARFDTPAGTSYANESNGGLTYGLGAQYDFMPTFAVRADWQRYAKVGSTTTGDAKDVDIWVVGVVWKLR